MRNQHAAGTGERAYRVARSSRSFQVRFPKSWRTVQKMTQRCFPRIKELRRRSFTINEIFWIRCKRQELKRKAIGLWHQQVPRGCWEREGKCEWRTERNLFCLEEAMVLLALTWWGGQLDIMSARTRSRILILPVYWPRFDSESDAF